MIFNRKLEEGRRLNLIFALLSGLRNTTCRYMSIDQKMARACLH